MRIVDDLEIRRHASVRFRSEYDYAVFEYWRSAKVLANLEKAGITTFNRVLDDGCGGGGMCVSFAEEARSVVGIEPGDRFRGVGTRLAAEKRVNNAIRSLNTRTRLLVTPLSTPIFPQTLLSFTPTSGVLTSA